VNFGNIDSSAGNISTITMSVGALGSADIGTIAASGTIGGYVFTLGSGAELVVGSASLGGTSAQTFGTILVSGLDAASANIGDVTAASGIGAVTVYMGSAATFSAGTLTSTGIGAITLTGSGIFNLEGLVASAGTIGAISYGDGGAEFSATTIDAVTVGNITLAGDDAVLTMSAQSVGTLTLTGSAATVTFTGGSSAGVGAVAIAGSGQITVDFGDATGVASVTTVGHAGTATIDLASVTQSTTVTFGTGTNILEVSDYGDIVTLAANTGKDSIDLESTSSTVFVANFEVNGDYIGLATAGFSLGLLATSTDDYNSSAGSISFLTVSAAGATFLAAGSTSDTDVIVMATGTFFDFSGVLAALGTAGSLALGGSAAIAVSAGQLAVIWYDAANLVTKLTVVGFTGEGLAASISAGAVFDAVTAASSQTLVTFSGLDIRSAYSVTIFIDFGA